MVARSRMIPRTEPQAKIVTIKPRATVSPVSPLRRRRMGAKAWLKSMWVAHRNQLNHNPAPTSSGRRHQSLWSKPHSASTRGCRVNPARFKNESGAVSWFAGNCVIVRKKAYMAQRISRLRICFSPPEGIWKSASNQFAPGPAAAASRPTTRSI